MPVWNVPPDQQILFEIINATGTLQIKQMSDVGSQHSTCWRPDIIICHGIVVLPNWGLYKKGHHFADDTFKCIFVTETFCILINISLKFVPKIEIDNNPALI